MWDESSQDPPVYEILPKREMLPGHVMIVLNIQANFKKSGVLSEREWAIYNSPPHPILFPNQLGGDQ